MANICNKKVEIPDSLRKEARWLLREMLKQTQPPEALQPSEVSCIEWMDVLRGRYERTLNAFLGDDNTSGQAIRATLRYALRELAELRAEIDTSIVVFSDRESEHSNTPDK